jgi:hypothetical protein
MYMLSSICASALLYTGELRKAIDPACDPTQRKQQAAVFIRQHKPPAGSFTLKVAQLVHRVGSSIDEASIAAAQGQTPPPLFNTSTSGPGRAAAAARPSSSQGVEAQEERVGTLDAVPHARVVPKVLEQSVGKPRSVYAVRKKTWFDLATPVESEVEAALFMVIRDLYASNRLGCFSGSDGGVGSNEHRGESSQRLKEHDKHLSKHLKPEDYKRLAVIWNAVLSGSRMPEGRVGGAYILWFSQA